MICLVMSLLCVTSSFALFFSFIWKINQNRKLIQEREKLIQNLIHLNDQLQPYLLEIEKISKLK